VSLLAEAVNFYYYYITGHTVITDYVQRKGNYKGKFTRLAGNLQGEITRENLQERIYKGDLQYNAQLTNYNQQ